MEFSQVMDASLDEGLRAYDISLKQALENIRSSNFYLPEPPMINDGGIITPYRGEIPSDITSESDQRLAWYLSMLSTWNNYCQTKTAEADINKSNLKEKLLFLDAKLSSALYGEKQGKKLLTNPQIAAVVRCDKRYIEINQLLMYWSALYRMARAMSESSAGNWNTISRRITQRGQDLDRDKRNPRGVIPAGPLFRR